MSHVKNSWCLFSFLKSNPTRQKPEFSSWVNKQQKCKINIITILKTKKLKKKTNQKKTLECYFNIL